VEITVVVCGDSFCSADTTDEPWHFSQLLQNQYGMKVINLARGGMSNLGICFQIKQAIELAPDVIVYNQADPVRVDLVMKPPSGKYSLKEFAYPYPYDSSYGSTYVGKKDAAIFSTVHQGLDKQKHVPVSNDQIQAVKYYHTHLFDWALKFESDSWWFGYWHQRIVESDILPVNLTGPNHLEDQDPIGKLMYDFVKKNPGWPKLYHTDRGTQEQVAQELYKKIQTNLKG